ncbi:unnamed protein product, partial [marine sediment metagenome]
DLDWNREREEWLAYSSQFVFAAIFLMVLVGGALLERIKEE